MELDNQNAPPRPCSAACSKPCPAGLGIVALGLARRAQAEAALEPALPAHDLPPATPQQLLADDSVKLAVLLTAQMFGLPRQIVIATVITGLPVLARLAERNSLLLARLYAGSRQPMLTSIELFYARLAESPFLHQALLDDYRATYGGMLDAVNRAAGQYAGRPCGPGANNSSPRDPWRPDATDVLCASTRNSRIASVRAPAPSRLQSRQVSRPTDRVVSFDIQWPGSSARSGQEWMLESPPDAYPLSI